MKKKHQSIRLFKSDFLESLSHVHPIMPLIVWLPIIIFLFFKSATEKNTNLSDFILFFFIGIFIWTLTEYVLHRFVFHFDGNSKVSKRLVYMFHGLHHDDPQDPTRLVMPPIPALILVGLLWQFFSIFVFNKYIELFMGFFLIGYLCYDYTHYAVHHFHMTSKIGRYLRKYHLQHHYASGESKFGVSNPFWDYVFQTLTISKKKAINLN